MVEFGADAYAHRKQVYVKQLYNQVPWTAWVSQFEFSSSRSWSQGQDAELRASGRQRAWALSDPWYSSPAKTRKKCCYVKRNFGSVCSSLSLSPPHLSHITNSNPFATLSRIKCERYIFYKEVCSFVHWSRHYVDYVSAYSCIRIRIVMVVTIQYRTGASPSDCFVSYPEYTLGGTLPLCRDAVGVFYIPSRLGCNIHRHVDRIWYRVTNKAWYTMEPTNQPTNHNTCLRRITTIINMLPLRSRRKENYTLPYGCIEANNSNLNEYWFISFKEIIT